MNFQQSKSPLGMIKAWSFGQDSLLAFKSGLPFFHECGHALFLILCTEEHAKYILLDLLALTKRRAHAFTQGCLCCAKGHGGTFHEFGGKLFCSVLKIIKGYNPVDQANALCLVCLDHLTQQEEFRGRACAHEAG